VNSKFRHKYNFKLLQSLCPDQLWGPPSPYSMDTGGSFPCRG